jgi:uncharacterized OsmC-like protein
MASVRTTYDGPQHCSALKDPHGNTVAMDCPYTGKGEEFSPTNLMEAALAGCMLLSMGALATRNEIDISGARIEVKISITDKPVMRFDEIAIKVTMPRDFSKKDRVRLERSAEGCPIKHSFDSDIPISVSYSYPN